MAIVSLRAVCSGALALLLAAALTRPLLALNDKVFCLGPGKTGTSTLETIFRKRGYKPCHGACGTMANWADSTRKQSVSLYASNDAFMDHGAQADYAWLAEAFPHARFVLNTRALDAWLISRADHVGRKRKALGCSPSGTKESCPAAKSGADNSDLELKHWIVGQAEKQESTLAFFNRTHALRNRFVVLDVEGWTPAQVNRALDWVTRPNPNATRHSVRNLVLSPDDIPLQRHEHTQVPDRNTHAHPKATGVRVQELLRAAGCTGNMAHAIFYADCARLVARTLPPTRVPRKSGARRG